MNSIITPKRGDYVVTLKSTFGEVLILRCRLYGSKRTQWVGEGSNGQFQGSGFNSAFYPLTAENHRIWTEEQVCAFQARRQALFEALGCPQDEARETFKSALLELARTI